MASTIPMDLDLYDSGPTSLASAMKALIQNGAHFTDSMRLRTEFGRGTSVFLRVHVPPDNVDRLRADIGKRGELRNAPKVDLGPCWEIQP